MKETKHTGSVAWMAKHPVAANLLMVAFLLGGLLFSFKIKKEVFPDFELDMITILVPYPGTTPAEIEQSVILAVEEAIDGIEGIKEVTSIATENIGTVNVELMTGIDKQQVYQEIQQAVDGIRTLPVEAEKPIVSITTNQRRVISVVLYGDVSDTELKKGAYELKNRLTAQKDISKVDIDEDKRFEVKIEVKKEMLEKYNLTLQAISNKIRQESLELSSGIIRSDSGDILVRLNERRFYADEFATIPIATTANGGIIRLIDIATIQDDFEEVKRVSTFNDKAAIPLEIYRSGNQTPKGVSEATKRVLEEFNKEHQDKFQTIVTRDMADVYQQRLELLLKNGFLGLVLVIVILGLFLNFKLAIWVSLGIPISFLGSILFLPFFDVSINMVSMFAFIITLGIVVDDAIIAGENIYEYKQRGMESMEAAIEGIKDISVPLTFAILTNIVAFAPLFMIPGGMGSIFGVIPAVITAVFIISWIEAVYILPRHLAYTSKPNQNSLIGHLDAKQQYFADAFNNFVENKYKPFLEFTIKHRYITIAIGFALLFIALAYAKSGRLGFTFMPRVESNRAVAIAKLPIGSPLEQSIKIRDNLIQAGLVVTQRYDSRLPQGHQASINEDTVTVNFFFDDSLGINFSTAKFNNEWREEIGSLIGIDSIMFRSDIGGPGGGASSLSIELSHTDNTILGEASQSLANSLRSIDFITEVEESYSSGKEEYTIELLPYAHTLGVSASDIASALRASFFGSESIRQQRGEHEVRVRVVLDNNQRKDLSDLYNFDIFTPKGDKIPLSQLAHLKQGQSHTSIMRRDGARVYSVDANVVPEENIPQVTNKLASEIFPELRKNYPNIGISYQGRQADTAESMGSLMQGFVMVLIVIYVLLAIPLASYLQPIIVMISIPFGAVGAFIGHYLMGYSLSVISIMGIIALAGVVINNSLVLIDYANKKISQNISPTESIILAGVRRFRPIVLTTVTTFVGLAPMILETSIQARFLIPMAISLGFGILFATLISLLLVPAFFVALEDIKNFIAKLLQRETKKEYN